jgi:hypothetical protein
MRVSGVSRVSAHGSPRRGNGITEIAENSIRQALPKPSTTNVHDLDPDLESEIMPKETADPESAVIMAAELREEAEMSLFSTMLFPPERRP